MSVEKALELIKESEAKFVDLRFTDTKGKEQHVSIPASVVDEEFFEEGKMFDGSSIAGWKGINESDMVLLPDATSCVVDPFAEETQVNIRCDIVEPSTMEGYERDPRSVARRAEEFLKSTGIGDTCFFGPEPEFSFLMTYASTLTWQVLSSRLTLLKLSGTLAKSLKAATWHTALALKAVTSQYHQWTLLTISVLQCV